MGNNPSSQADRHVTDLPPPNYQHSETKRTRSPSISFRSPTMERDLKRRRAENDHTLRVDVSDRYIPGYRREHAEPRSAQSRYDHYSPSRPSRSESWRGDSTGQSDYASSPLRGPVLASNEASPQPNRRNGGIASDPAVPRGPKSRNPQMLLPEVSLNLRKSPHLFISSKHIPANPGTIQHLRGRLKDFLVRIEVDNTGYYIFWGDNEAPRDNLSRCYRKFHRETLFTYTMVMEPFPYGFSRFDHALQAADTSATESTTKPASSPPATHSRDNYSSRNSLGESSSSQHRLSFDSPSHTLGQRRTSNPKSSDIRQTGQTINHSVTQKDCHTQPATKSTSPLLNREPRHIEFNLTSLRKEPAIGVSINGPDRGKEADRGSEQHLLSTNHTPSSAKSGLLKTSPDVESNPRAILEPSEHVPIAIVAQEPLINKSDSARSFRKDLSSSSSKEPRSSIQAVGAQESRKEDGEHLGRGNPTQQTKVCTSSSIVPETSRDRSCETQKTPAQKWPFGLSKQIRAKTPKRASKSAGGGAIPNFPVGQLRCQSHITPVPNRIPPNSSKLAHVASRSTKANGLENPSHEVRLFERLDLDDDSMHNPKEGSVHATQKSTRKGHEGQPLATTSAQAQADVPIEQQHQNSMNLHIDMRDSDDSPAEDAEAGVPEDDSIKDVENPFASSVRRRKSDIEPKTEPVASVDDGMPTTIGETRPNDSNRSHTAARSLQDHDVQQEANPASGHTSSRFERSAGTPHSLSTMCGLALIQGPRIGMTRAEVVDWALATWSANELSRENPKWQNGFSAILSNTKLTDFCKSDRVHGKIQRYKLTPPGRKKYTKTFRDIFGRPPTQGINDAIASIENMPESTVGKRKVKRSSKMQRSKQIQPDPTPVRSSPSPSSSESSLDIAPPSLPTKQPKSHPLKSPVEEAPETPIQSGIHNIAPDSMLSSKQTSRKNERSARLVQQRNWVARKEAASMSPPSSELSGDEEIENSSVLEAKKRARLQKRRGQETVPLRPTAPTSPPSSYRTTSEGSTSAQFTAGAETRPLPSTTRSNYLPNWRIYNLNDGSISSTTSHGSVAVTTRNLPGGGPKAAANEAEDTLHSPMDVDTPPTSHSELRMSPPTSNEHPDSTCFDSPMETDYENPCDDPYYIPITQGCEPELGDPGAVHTPAEKLAMIERLREPGFGYEENCRDLAPRYFGGFIDIEENRRRAMKDPNRSAAARKARLGKWISIAPPDHDAWAEPDPRCLPVRSKPTSQAPEGPPQRTRDRDGDRMMPDFDEPQTCRSIEEFHGIPQRMKLTVIDGDLAFVNMDVDGDAHFSGRRLKQPYKLGLNG